MSSVIRVSDDIREWLDREKEDRFNTTEVPYRVVLEDIMGDIDDE